MTEPPNNQFDEQVQQLMIAAQQAPFRSRERQRALTQLFEQILRSR